MYSSAADMAERFGVVEMIRLTTPSGTALLDAPDPVMITRALTEASAVIDSYLRRRYLTPVTAAAPEITRAAAILARFDLMLGDDRQPSEQATAARKDVLEWLRGIRDGQVLLDLDLVPSAEESQAVVSTREPAFAAGARWASGWGGVG